MSSFFVANIKIKNDIEYNEYLKNVDNVFKKFKGKYLIVDKNPEILEGQWDYSRFVLIEFPDKETLKEWYYSKDYQEILKFRLSGAECDTIIAE
jgi:uncharacterized protein (DUF1330 family)